MPMSPEEKKIYKKYQVEAWKKAKGLPYSMKKFKGCDSKLMDKMRNNWSIDSAVWNALRFAQAKGKSDPSGIVYEAVLSNPVEGATVKLYEYNSKAATAGLRDPANFVDSTVFNLEENPQETGKDGRYQWFVPTGYWQVRVTKDGYQPVSTGDSNVYGIDATKDLDGDGNDDGYGYWMPVLPVQLDVNIPLMSNEAPVVQTMEADELGVTVTFSKYMLPDTVTASMFTIDGKAVGAVVPVDAEAAGYDANVTLARKFRVTYANDECLYPGAQVTVAATASDTVKSYADVPMTEGKSATLTVQDKGETTKVTPPVATNRTYNGAAQVGVPVGEGYTLSGTASATNVGTYTATAKLNDRCMWTDGTRDDKQLEWKISAATISAAAMTLGQTSYTYDGSAKVPGVTVRYNGATLVAGRDYTVAFANNVGAGTATVTVTGKGNFSGSKNATFRINPAAVSAVSVSPASFTYDGKAKTPGVTVKAGGITVLASGYSVSYKNNTNAGTATVTVTGKGYFAGSKSATFRIDPAQITSVAVSPASVEYDGKAKTPGVTVKAGGLTVPTSGYSVSYANNTNIGTATATVTGKGNFAGSKSATFSISAPARAGVTYQTHVQNIGDQGWRRDGVEAGTHGLSYRLEAIRIKLEGAHVPGSVEYRTHVQNIGWQDYRRDGAEAGTHGMSYRLEAIQIRLTGEMAQRYDVWYCVHAQDIGDMGWAKNDAPAGTAGFSRRLEAIRIRILPKGSPAPGKQHEAFVSQDGSTPQQSFSGHAVRSRTHVQDLGWQGWATDGQMSGTQGIEINLCDRPAGGSIEYRTHVQNIGWQGYVRDGQMSGTSGRSLRLEAIQLRLTGAMGLTHDVWYRVHAENFGWMGWARNDQQAGTAGFSYRLEGIEILVLPKGTPAPGPTANAFRQR